MSDKDMTRSADETAAAFANLAAQSGMNFAQETASDYISRDAAQDEACDRCNQQGHCNRTESCPIMISIRSIPAADVRPVVRGKWITRPYMMGNTQYCSLCNENYGMKHNFCPNCGADMREES